MKIRPNHPAGLLAIDLGAESGRAVLGRFDGQRVDMREVYRFPNDPVSLPNGIYWDILSIYRHILAGLSAAGAESGGMIDSLGIDSWAVDFSLLDDSGALLENPRHYRDPRNEGMLARAFARVPRRDIYRTTGIQALPINTLGQLISMEEDPALSIAQTMLLIPDLLRYWLTGDRSAEYTNATTTQLYDHVAGDWAWDLIRRLGIPERIFPPIVREATVGAPLRASIARDAGLKGAPGVIAVASHDTASAVVAVPARSDRFAYISSGTWSLVGVELPEPLLTDAAMEDNFTNEGGAFGTIRFLKNVMGLWLLQECRRMWQRDGRDTSYEELVAQASTMQPFAFLIDPDDPSFLAPGDMPARIAAYCQRTGQGAPEGIPEVTRCILESLALKYRWVIERIQALTGREIDLIHIVGGGARSATLCQLTADATGRQVIAGPIEATAMGNILIQAVAHGHLDSLPDIREVVRNSSELVSYEPRSHGGEWDDAYARLLNLMASHVQAPERSCQDRPRG
jgi:rhamnulokinase